MSVFYIKEYYIEDYMCDRCGILHPSFALKLVQSIAIAHCGAMGTYEKISARGQVFLITKQTCEFYRPVRAGETLILKSAPTEVVRGIFPRVTYFETPLGEVVGFCDARWFLFDINKKRPMRKMDDDVCYPILSGYQPQRIVFPNSKTEFLREEAVRYCQIDTNGHLNNAEYLNYLSDTLQDCFVKKFQVSYKKEIKEGAVRLEIARDGNIVHLVGYNEGNKNFEILAEIEQVSH